MPWLRWRSIVMGERGERQPAVASDGIDLRVARPEVVAVPGCAYPSAASMSSMIPWAVSRIASIDAFSSSSSRPEAQPAT